MVEYMKGMPNIKRLLRACGFVAALAAIVRSGVAASPTGDATPLPIASPNAVASVAPGPSSSSSPSPFDDPPADAAARKITPAQLIALIKALYTLGQSVAIDTRPPAPASSRTPPRYEGKQSDGKSHLATDGGLACIHYVPHTEIDEADCFGALLSIAADSGSAGNEMQLAYDRAKDKHEFARIIGRALQLENLSEEAKSEADIAWMQALPIGEKRADVYIKLRGRGIVVYNQTFNPGKALGTGGCDYGATKAAAAYPTFGESLPIGGCDRKMFRPRSADGTPITVAPKSPTATAEFDLGFDLACGYTKSVELDFDAMDRLSNVVVSPERNLCL